MKVRLTAKDAAERLGVSYVIAAGLLSHLEERGRAVVVEKRFHASGKGKPTRVYEVDQDTVIDFGAVTTPAVAVPVPAPAVDWSGLGVAKSSKEPVIETLDHVAAAVRRLKEAQDADAA